MLGGVVLILLCVCCVSASSFSYRNGSNEIIRCMEKERLALLSFRAGLTVTSDVGSLPSWSSKDCCEWSGVECNNLTGHVTKLDLQDPFGLAGKFSPSMIELRELTYLDLRFIDFEKRPIPQFLGSFTKLKHLDLSNCSLAGIVPSQLGNLSNLNHLALSSDPSLNLTVENIEWLSHLSSLESLYMDGVDLSRATNWVDIIKTLPFLTTLDFSRSQLSKVTIPYSSSINSSSTSIKALHLSSNGFTSSSVLFNLSSSLQLLSLSNNMLNSPDSIAFGDYMHSLQYLDLSFNLLKGMLPNSFGNLCNLVQLDLKYNSLSGNLTDFLDILSSSRCSYTPALELLLVDCNKLYGPLPDSIIRFSSLKHLSLSSNQLNGTLTKNLGALSQLEWLDLSNNSLTDTLSEAHFSNRSILADLNLANNALHIKVSPQWTPNFQLSSIRLMSCNLGPLFPNWIRTQKNVNHLDISNAGISDNIPSWFWIISAQCQYLNLSSNNFTGTLPDLSSKEFQGYSGKGFDLSSNSFEGQIPLFPSTSASINLSGNKFSGNLNFLCQLNDMFFSFLDISHNLLTGGLPDCLGKLELLTVANLAHNQISGEIPSSIGSLHRLESLYLYNNSFTGELPVSLSNCVRLSFLDVGVNKLTGNIPAWIGGNISQLRILSLRSNKFNGTIPLNLCKLNELHVLDLSQNNFHGNIPPCLNNLSSMVHKEIEQNFHQYLSTVYPREGFYIDYSVIGWQGSEQEFGNTLWQLKLIDLSSNKLSGEIPDEITDLLELVALNLSRNLLRGKVPQEIGQLKSIISLDLSRNKFSGEIPTSLSQLSFLSHLDLSYNKFSGKIPSSTQIQSQDASKFIGNVGLCGLPLQSKCEPPHTIVNIEDNGEENVDDEFMKWLYIGMASGFITGFWGICGVLFLYRRGRHAFFLFTNDLIDSVYVRIATCKF